ncbi:MAG TPA: hypothetical protein VFU65_00580 [Actinocrinis sp.]|nr:hypothetical protein [Actinocrinis sp.]
MIRPSQWGDLERAVAAQHARLDRHRAVYGVLCSAIEQIASRLGDASTGTGRRMASVYEGLQRADSMLQTWRRILDEADQALTTPRCGTSLDRAVALLCDETVSLDTAALRKEDRRPPGMAAATHLRLCRVEENVEGELRAVERVVVQIDRRREAATRIKSLFVMAVEGKGEPDPLHGRVAAIVELAESDPLGISPAEAAALERELAAARRLELSILIDRLEAEENELRRRLSVTAARAGEPLQAVRAAAGLRGRLRALETLGCDRTPEADRLPEELASLASEATAAIARLRDIRANTTSRACTRPGCSGRGVIEKDGTCDVCFLPPEKEPR